MTQRTCSSNTKLLGSPLKSKHLTGAQPRSTKQFVDMILKGQWIVLPYKDVKNIPWLCLSPPGVNPQWGCCPRWIVMDRWLLLLWSEQRHSCYGVNDDTIPLIKKESMQFGHALNCLLQEILLANPTNGYVGKYLRHWIGILFKIGCCCVVFLLLCKSSGWP